MSWKRSAAAGEWLLVRGDGAEARIDGKQSGQWFEFRVTARRGFDPLELTDADAKELIPLVQEIEPNTKYLSLDGGVLLFGKGLLPCWKCGTETAGKDLVAVTRRWRAGTGHYVFTALLCTDCNNFKSEDERMKWMMDKEAELRAQDPIRLT